MEVVVTSRVVTVHHDIISGDYVVPIPEDILEELGWKPGDVVQLEQNIDGSIEVTKRNEK